MIEPVAMKDFFITFFSSALIILAGVSYAILFAWGNMKQNLRVKFLSYLSFSILVIAVFELTRAANFTGHWQILTWIMVMGYFFAPIGIWHLAVSTHDQTFEHENKGDEDE